MSRTTPTPVEPRSLNERLLVRLDKLPRALPVLAVFGLLVLGTFVPSYGWIATTLVAAFLAWMLTVSWPRLTGVEKLMRIAVLFFIAAIALVQARPR
ncbi:MAG TPA: hypothetical protein PKH97_01700 [Tetrasphaera sp.]|uniref:DUF6703 family protein n=1 Tax=Nostocoides sp. TaxID=1917966 RepID=UPI002C5197E6|nr:DUF6703 family protein [Tetrasphaera sp.]HNQ05880.1 hypothetical protein [Tetrasphaera sp.]